MLDEGLFKELMKIRDSVEIDEKVDTYPYDAVGAIRSANVFHIILTSSGEAREDPGHILGTSDDETEAVETARKLASILDINFKGLIGEAKVNEQDEEPEEEAPEEPKPKELEKPEAPEIKKSKPEEEEVPEITKEYVGNTEDDHYYLISIEDEEGNVEDLQVVDQEGVEKFSAKANSIEVTNVPEFLFKGIKELRIESIEFGIFEQYLFPYVFEQEEEEEEEIEGVEGLEDLEEPEKPIENKNESKINEQEEGKPRPVNVSFTVEGYDLENDGVLDGDLVGRIVEIAFEDDETLDAKLSNLVVDGKKYTASESKKHLVEMKITDHENNTFDVYLVDDGTLDTVIDISGREFRFVAEFASYWRDEEGALSEEGLGQLALDALSNLDEDSYNELVARSAEAGEETPSVKMAEPVKRKGLENEGKKTNEQGYHAITDDDESLRKAFYEYMAQFNVPTWEEGIEGFAKEHNIHSIELRKRLSHIIEGKDNPGVRDGTGPAKGSAQRSRKGDVGRRKEQGEKCPKESKTSEARMGVDYVKGVKASTKTATQALKDKDYEAAAKALEDVADDAADAAKAAKKMKREVDAKANAEKAEEAVVSEGDQIPGGLADENKPEDFDPEQIRMGIEIEKEHTADPEKAREIAMDHLKEDPEYYTHLKKMEMENESKIRESKSDKSMQLTNSLLNLLGTKETKVSESPKDNLNDEEEMLKI